MLISSSSDATVTTIAGGLTGEGAILPLSGHVDPALTQASPFTGGSVTDTMAQVIPADISLGAIYATAIIKAPLALVGTTITLNATLYHGILGGPYSATPLECNLAPALTGIIAIGTTASCSATTGPVSFTAGEVGFAVVSATAAGISLINTVSLATSVSFGPGAPP